MGIYTNTSICYGFKCDDMTIVEKLNSKQYFMLDNCVIVFLPRTRKDYPSIDPIINESEVNQSFVSMSDVVTAFKIETDFFDVCPGELTTLADLMDTYEIEKDNLKSWIIETTW